MTIVEPVTLATVQAHEQATAANVRLGGYHMDLVSATSEFQLFRATLEDVDLGRLFLLGLDEFAVCTGGKSCRMPDLLPVAALLPRVAPFIRDRIDLPARPDRALLIVSPDPHAGPLVLTDGNHRAMAYFSMHKSMQGVPAFVCVHPRIRGWNFLPPLARAA